MVYIKREGVLLEPSELEFESQAVFNPTCITKGDYIHMFYRAVDKKYCSRIGYCKLNGPLDIIERAEEPVLYPEFEWERHGVEDPRIVEIDGTYYLFYTAYDGKNAAAAYAISKDLKNFEKKGIISPDMSYEEAGDLFHKLRLKEKYRFFEAYYKDVVGEDVLIWHKDVFMFPKKIKGKFALVHRILPDIHIAYFEDFNEINYEYWKNYFENLSENILLSSKYWYESGNIGGGCVPIETGEGWLFIYHAVEDSDRGKIYHAAAALLDIENPQQVIGHLHNPLFSPQEKYELYGDVNNVVFPTGTAIFDDKLYIYYGAADKRIAVVSLDINELLDELIHSSNYYDLLYEIEDSAEHIYHSVLKKSLDSTNLENLKDIVDKDEKLILMAIGWLAREGKIDHIDLKKDEIKIKK